MLPWSRSRSWGPSLARPDASLLTFVVQELADLEEAFKIQVPKKMLPELSGVILLSHSFSKEALQAFAAGLPCRCFHVVTYGLVGWDANFAVNHEVEQEGRAKEFGAAGVNKGRSGLLVIAVREAKGAKGPRIVLSTGGSAPTKAEGAVGHVLFPSNASQDSMMKLVASSVHCVCAGGLCGTISEWQPSGWKEGVDMVTLTLMKADDCLFNVTATDPLAQDLACRGEAKEMLESLPDGYRPEFVGMFPCVMRGQSWHGTGNVETKELEKLVGQRIPAIGCMGLCEIGNTKARKPAGWRDPESEATTLHGGSVVVCCYAVPDPSIAKWKPDRPIQDPFHALEAPEADPAQSLGFLARTRSLWECMSCCSTSGNAPTNLQMVTAVESTAEAEDDAALSKFPAGGTDDEEFQKVLRAVPLEACADGGQSYLFWKPNAIPNSDLYKMSRPVQAVDVFISQVIMPPKDADMDIYAFFKAVDTYVGATQLSMKVHTNLALAKKLTSNLTFWVDRACVDQDDEDNKMRIIKNYLDDFLINARFFLCLLSPHYFTRLWCIFEFCCAWAYREDFSTIVFAGIQASVLSVTASMISESIVSLSVASARCFDLRDRQVIEEKIKTNFNSVKHFEDFAKLAALAVIARGALPIIIEFNGEGVWEIWMDAVRQCRLTELETAMAGFDIAAAAKRLKEELPDTPSQTHSPERIRLCGTEIVTPWFTEQVAPLIRAKRAEALRSNKSRRLQ